MKFLPGVEHGKMNRMQLGLIRSLYQDSNENCILLFRYSRHHVMREFLEENPGASWDKAREAERREEVRKWKSFDDRQWKAIKAGFTTFQRAEPKIVEAKD